MATGAGFGNMTVWLENDGKAVPGFTLRNISAVQQNVSRVVSGDLDSGVCVCTRGLMCGAGSGHGYATIGADSVGLTCFCRCRWRH